MQRATGMRSALPHRRQARRHRTLRRLFTRAALLALGAFIAGFFVFVGNLPAADGAAPPHADAIVALTGGANRLAVSLDLLAAQAGRRLLITGVAATTTREDLQARYPESAALIGRDVDLDWQAADTRGNARETAAWARRHGVARLIVVTAHYHMPRALTELAAALPEVELIPYPVAPATVRIEAWWHDPATFELLAGEYCKYLASLALAGAQRAFG